VKFLLFFCEPVKFSWLLPPVKSVKFPTRITGQLRDYAAKELVATGRENDGSDMPRRAAFPRFIPGFRNPTP